MLMELVRDTWASDNELLLQIWAADPLLHAWNFWNLGISVIIGLRALTLALLFFQAQFKPNA